MTNTLHLAKANYHYSLHEYWYALKYYRKIPLLFRYPPDEIAGYGFSLLYTEQIDDALQFFTTAAKKCSSKTILDGLGWSLLAKNKYSKADKAFQISVEYSKDWNTLRGLAKAKQGLGQYTQSLALGFESYGIVPHTGTLIDIADTYRLMREYSASLRIYKLAASLGFGVEAYKSLGMVYFELRNYSASAKALGLVSREKVDAETHLYLGLSQVYTIDSTSAIKSLWLSTRGKPTAASTLSYLHAISNEPRSSPEREFKSFVLSCLQLAIDGPGNQERISCKFANVQSVLIGNKIPAKALNALQLVYEWFAYHSHQPGPEKKIANDGLSPESKPMDKLLRKWMKANQIRDIVSFGDSHGAIFQELSSVEHFYVGAATAYNLNNPNSTTGHHNKIINILRDYDPGHTVVILTFGEIDLRSHIPRISSSSDKAPEYAILKTIDQLEEFSNRLIAKGFKVIVNAPHCGGGPYSQLEFSMQERNHYCFLMKFFLELRSNKGKFHVISLFDACVDQSTLENQVLLFRDATHLKLPSTRTGSILQQMLLRQLTRLSFVSRGDVDRISKDPQPPFYGQKFCLSYSYSAMILLSCINGLPSFTPCRLDRPLPYDSSYKTSCEISFAIFRLIVPLSITSICIWYKGCPEKPATLSCKLLATSSSDELSLTYAAIHPNSIATKADTEKDLDMFQFEFECEKYPCTHFIVELCDNPQAEIREISATYTMQL